MHKAYVNQDTPASHLRLQPLISWWLWSFLSSYDEKYLTANIIAIIYTFIFIQKYERQELGSLLRSDKAEGNGQGTLQSFSLCWDMVSVGDVFLILPGNKAYPTPYTYCTTRFEATSLNILFYEHQEFRLLHAARKIDAALNSVTPLITW